MAEVAFKQVQKSFGAVQVLKQIDLTVADGEFLVLVGPSGCGKSTLLRALAGLEGVTHGRDPDRWPRGQRPAAERPGHRDGVPELRAVSAYERAARTSRSR